jgi:hypothetical protein
VPSLIRVAAWYAVGLFVYLADYGAVSVLEVAAIAPHCVHCVIESSALERCRAPVAQVVTDSSSSKQYWYDCHSLITYHSVNYNKHHSVIHTNERTLVLYAVLHCCCSNLFGVAAASTDAQRCMWQKLALKHLSTCAKQSVST